MSTITCNLIVTRTTSKKVDLQDGLFADAGGSGCIAAADTVFSWDVVWRF